MSKEPPTPQPIRKKKRLISVSVGGIFRSGDFVFDELKKYTILNSAWDNELKNWKVLMVERG